MFVGIEIDGRFPIDTTFLSPTTTPGLHHHSCGGRARLERVGCLGYDFKGLRQLI